MLGSSVELYELHAASVLYDLEYRKCLALKAPTGGPLICSEMVYALFVLTRWNCIALSTASKAGLIAWDL